MRHPVAVLVLGATLALGAAASPSSGPGPSPTPAPTPWPIDLDVRVSVTDPRFLVTRAIADSLESGIRMVRVRIVESMTVRIELSSAGGVTLAETPQTCLHWYWAAPDDAGLESPCWGAPDPTEPLAALAGDDGTWTLGPGTSFVVDGPMTRADGRCDYPPGEWVVRLRVVPLVDDTPADPVYLRRSFELGFDRAEALPEVPLPESRFCGLAATIVRDQGEPEVAPS